MKNLSSKILRISLAITFIWIGVLIIKDPIFWSGFLPSWILELSPLSATQLMMTTAVLDLIIGILFLVNVKVHIAALLASAHLVGILILSGIGDVTVRDIGLLGASLALLVETMPKRWKIWQ